jgi:hypothetical protein
MDIRTFITNPVSCALTTFTIGLLWGYQIGLEQGLKQTTAEIYNLKIVNSRMDEKLKINEERFLLLMKKIDKIEGELK